MGDPKKYWVGFNLVKGIGAVRFRVLLSAFGDAEIAWSASAEELRAAGIGPRSWITSCKFEGMFPSIMCGNKYRKVGSKCSPGRTTNPPVVPERLISLRL